jgi:hypothetical protein
MRNLLGFATTIEHVFSGRWLGETDLSRVTTVIFLLILGAAFAAFTEFQPILWGLAALMCGGLLGFLFGIPRVEQQANVTANGTTQTDSEPNGRYRQRVNTNLEEISDWLTKIIVGIGLVQLSQIPAKFESVAVFLAGDEYKIGLAATILVVFGIIGFFAGYLLTRLFLASAFSRADQLAMMFTMRVDRLAEEASQMLPTMAGTVAAEENVSDQTLSRLIEVSPRAAIVEAWIHVEEAARSAVERRGAPPARSPLELERQLGALQILDRSQIGAYRELRNLRNVAAHEKFLDIATSRAEEYVSIANRLAHQLRSEPM